MGQRKQTERIGGLAVFLSGFHRARKSWTSPDTVVHIWNPSPQEAEAERWQGPSTTRTHSDMLSQNKKQTNKKCHTRITANESFLESREDRLGNTVAFYFLLFLPSLSPSCFYPCLQAVWTSSGRDVTGGTCEKSGMQYMSSPQRNLA